MPIKNFEEYKKLNEEEQPDPLGHLNPEGDGGTETDTLDDVDPTPLEPITKESITDRVSDFFSDMITPSWSTAGLVLGTSYATAKILKFVRNFKDPVQRVLEGGVNNTAKLVMDNGGKVIDDAKYLANKAKNVVIKYVSLDDYKRTWKAIRMATGKQLSRESSKIFTKLIMSSENAEEAVKRLKDFQKSTGMSKNIIEDVENKLFDKVKNKKGSKASYKPKLKSEFKNIIKQGGTTVKKTKAGRAAYWAANNLPGRKVFGTLSKKVSAKAAAWGLGKIARAAISPLAKLGAKLGLTVSGVGTAIGIALLAAEVYTTATWLMGDKTLFEPKEGWAGGNHTTPGERKESQKSYEMMNSSIQLAIGIGKEANGALASTFGNKIIIGPPPLEADEEFFKNELGRYAGFLANLIERIEDNQILNNFDNINKEDDDLIDEIKLEYSGYPVSGRSGDDVELIDDIMTKDHLNDEDQNIYKMRVAEDGGSGVLGFIEDKLGFIPGLNPLGWAHIFLSHDYIDALDMLKDLDRKTLLGLIHKASLVVKINNGNVDITKDDIPKLLSAMTGKATVNTDILDRLVVGELEEDKELREMGKISDAIDVIVNHVNSSYNDIISQNTKLPITTAMMALSTAVAVRELLRLTVLGGGTYFAILEGSAILSETLRTEVDKVLAEAGVEADKELESELTEVDQEMDADIETARKEVEEETKKDVSIDVETEEDGGDVSVDDAAESQDVQDVFRTLPGFDDYIG